MMTEVKRPRILLADDHALVAAGLAKLLEPDFDLVAISCDGRQVVAEAKITQPDVVLLDISMPNLNGIEAARQIHQALPQAKIVFVTVHTDLSYVVAAVRAGANGYVLKGSAVSELREAISAVLQGKRYVTPLLEGPALDAMLQAPEHKSPLTRRQWEVLQMVAEGRSAKAVGASLRISSKTVEFHKSVIMKRLNLHSVAELTRYAIEHGPGNN
jgi:DNA-binding NarL/FixJ family response regulator